MYVSIGQVIVVNAGCNKGFITRFQLNNDRIWRKPTFVTTSVVRGGRLKPREKSQKGKHNYRGVGHLKTSLLCPVNDK